MFRFRLRRFGRSFGTRRFAVRLRGRCGEVCKLGRIVQVQNLVTNLLQVFDLQLFGELVPPVDVGWETALPIFDFELGQLGGQVHHGDGDDLRLPRQTQGRA